VTYYSGYRESCRGLFKELKILTLASQYIFSLLLFFVHNRGYFAPNTVYHNFNTRHKNDLHLPHVFLIIHVYERGVFYSGIKIFYAVPTTIKDIYGNSKKFKVALKHYLLTHSFYNLDKFSVNRILDLRYATNNLITQILITIVLTVSIAIYLLFYNYHNSVLKVSFL
jgi:hypothetical protein